MGTAQSRFQHGPDLPNNGMGFLWKVSPGGIQVIARVQLLMTVVMMVMMIVTGDEEHPRQMLRCALCGHLIDCCTLFPPSTDEQTEASRDETVFARSAC